ncbi:MAG: hypothetical protein ACP5MK_00690 [Candidatus Micrarchaeia archaeon]
MSITVHSRAEPEKIKAFRTGSNDIILNVSTTDSGPFWVEGIFDIEPPLSFAPDQQIKTAKSTVGIVWDKHSVDKRIKVFSQSNVYPNTYKMKITFFIYDKDAVISDRVEHTVEIECVGDAKVL